MNVEWMSSAACTQVDPEVFYPTGVGVVGQREVERARRICSQCPVEDACAEYAKRFAHGWGVWGGQSRRRVASVGKPAISHGTAGGYKAHQRRHEKACESCLRAHRLANQLRQERSA